MTPGRHVLASGLVAVACGSLWHSRGAAAAAFIAGTAIDIDHVIDYRLNGMPPFTVPRFLDACNRFRLRRFYLVLHSLEWILPFLAWTATAGGAPWIKAAGLGLGVHMAMDLLGNGMRVPAYFLTVRAAAGFDARQFVYQLPPEALATWGSLDAWREAGPPRDPGRASTRT
jgi:hypothetical protein